MELYEYIENSFLPDPLTPKTNRLVIIGTSGIGKSARKGKWYAFGGTATQRVGIPEDLEFLVV